MSHSKFAMNCPDCLEINEPAHKNRQPSGNIKATYRCEKGHTWQQQFIVSLEVPLVDEPEEKEEKKLPKPPSSEVMQWTDQERNEYLEAYGESSYKKLVGKHFQEGEAFAEPPKNEPTMPQDLDPRKWSSTQRDNFITKWGRETYQERLSNAYKADREPAEAYD